MPCQTIPCPHYQSLIRLAEVSTVRFRTVRVFVSEQSDTLPSEKTCILSAF
ncbi:hypothetical protein HMPREF1988_02073 [Porphyromonas gingivalis F0185]|nr:hypothetical protein HMPREF1988_02073 [Porphyromonas gingivalis F0185]